MAEERDGDGDVVEDAVAGAFCAEGVVRASGESSPESVLKGDAGCGESSTDTGESALHKLFGPGKSDAAHDRRGQCSGDEIADVLRIVREFDDGGGCKRRGLQIETAILLEQLAKHAVFTNRKAMSFRQREDVMIGIKEYGTHEGYSIRNWSGAIQFRVLRLVR